MWFCKNKQYTLHDILRENGMIDIHSHFLCCVDDGAKNSDQTKNIICALKEYGINQSFVTPHIKAPVHNYTPDNLTEIFNSSLLPLAKELDFEVRLAAEYMLDDNFLNHLNAQTPPLTFDGKHILVEVSTVTPSLDLQHFILEIKNAGYIPILAHPERYIYMTKENLIKLKAQGVLLQTNLFSIAGAYGEEVAKNAYSLLESGILDFVATDVHNATTLEKFRLYKVSEKHSLQLQQLINNNNKLWV